MEYPYKKADDFKALEYFKSIEDFEAIYKHYTQKCLDNTGGGSGGSNLLNMKNIVIKKGYKTFKPFARDASAEESDLNKSEKKMTQAVNYNCERYE